VAAAGRILDPVEGRQQFEDLVLEVRLIIVE
jgi:hypothetical protein